MDGSEWSDCIRDTRAHNIRRSTRRNDHRQRRPYGLEGLLRPGKTSGPTPASSITIETGGRTRQRATRRSLSNAAPDAIPSLPRADAARPNGRSHKRDAGQGDSTKCRRFALVISVFKQQAHRLLGPAAAWSSKYPQNLIMWPDILME